MEKAHLLLFFLLLGSSLHFCSGSSSRKLFSLVKEAPLVLSYHNGPLLTGNLSLSILWYGRFSPAQKSILLDFLTSLNTKTPPKPSVSSWWKTLDSYHSSIHPKTPHIYNSALHLHIHNQALDPTYSLGKSLTRAQITKLAETGLAPSGSAVSVVLTSDDVAVEGFCIGGCARHGSVGPDGVSIWVGNPASQCPGECAWPFHQPVYGPQAPPLVAPNGDVGADGMVIGLASALAAAVTNPFRTGFFQGPASAPLEAASACTGAYGSGAYPGYAGELLVDPTTGGSYNAHGVNGRKYLLPAVWDPLTSKCSTLV
ncbi:protein PHOSPHATE-INDUCED 1-like [Magnolia sinica]|uniref:protein PHOSPHATE-INDUCED 1-like n=1 Tax=Magnolia sinica TaxID=86752 RepID=UPI002657E995|nr:protein PHOSPHATE-INDUCED 1-like [Magnolia sinica]